MKPRIYLGMNLLSTVNQAVDANHFDLGYTLGKSGKYEIIRHTQPRTSIDRMRNECAKNALLYECTHLWFKDDDIIVPLNVLDSMMEADKDIVMAHTYIRGYPFHPMSFKATNDDPKDIHLTYYDDLKDHRDENGLVECAAVGFSCALIKTWLLKELSSPYFITSPTGTEDVYFCMRCRQEIDKPISIFTDTKVPTYHLLDPEGISEESLPFLKNFFEEYLKMKDEQRQDRGELYHKMIREMGK